MPVKGTIFDQFSQNAYDFQGSLSKLINTFLSAIGNDLLNINVLGNINIKSILSVIQNPSAAISGLESSLQADIMKGIDEFKQMTSESMLAVYNTALGFSENVVNSYMAALISQIYCPEDIFLWTVQQMYSKGSNPDLNDTLRNACYKHDLVKTITWLDNYDNTSYSIFELYGIQGGITASEYGSFNVALYVMDKIVSSMNEYMSIPLPALTDPTYQAAKQTFDSNVLQYKFYLHLIAKNIFVYSYSNLYVNTWGFIIKKYNIDPQAFGTTDKLFAGACMISSNEIDILAPYYTAGIIGASQGTIYQIGEQDYIDPRNSNIKYLYLYIFLPDQVGVNNVIVHEELHQRMLSTIISTYLKALVDSSSSLITTGLGKFMNTVAQDIKALISNFAISMDAYLFDPSKQKYIVSGDNPTIPPETANVSAGTSSGNTPTVVNNYNMLGNVDVRNFRVYTFERDYGETDSEPISNDEFNQKIVRMIYNITKAGKYLRYDIFSTTKQTRIYNSLGTFTGTYLSSSEDFYIFSIYDSSSTDPSLSLSSFQNLVMKYLIDNYGIERLSYLKEVYPNLPFDTFVSQFLTQLENSSENYSDGSLPGTQDIIGIQTSSLTLQQLWEDYQNATNNLSLDQQQIASLQSQITSLQNQLAAALNSNADPSSIQTLESNLTSSQNQLSTLNSTLSPDNIMANITSTQNTLLTETNSLISSLGQISNPGSLSVSDGASYYNTAQTPITMFENGQITSTALINSLVSLQNKLNMILIQAGIFNAVELNSLIYKLLTLLPTVSTITQEVSLLLTQLVQDLNIVISDSKAGTLSSGIINQLQSIINVLVLLDPGTPSNNMADDLNAVLSSLNSSMNDLILMETNSSIILKGRFLSSKSLVLSRSQAILRAFYDIIELPPTSAVKDPQFLISKWNSIVSDLLNLVNSTFVTLETYISNSSDINTVETLKSAYVSTISTDMGTLTSFLNSPANITLISNWDTPTITTLLSNIRSLMTKDFSSSVTTLFDSCLDSIINWGSQSVAASEALYDGLQNDLMGIFYTWTDSIDNSLLNLTPGANSLITSLQSLFNNYTSEQTYYNFLISSLPSNSSNTITSLISSVNTQINTEINNILNSIVQFINAGVSSNSYSVFTNSNVISLQEFAWTTLFNELYTIDTLILRIKQAVRQTVTNTEIVDLTNRIEIMKLNAQTVIQNSMLTSDSTLTNQISQIQNDIVLLQEIVNSNPQMYTDITTITAPVAVSSSTLNSLEETILKNIENMMDNPSNTQDWNNPDGTFKYATELANAQLNIAALVSGYNSGSSLFNTTPLTGPTTNESMLQSQRNYMAKYGDIDISDPNVSALLYTQLTSASEVGTFTYIPTII